MHHHFITISVLSDIPPRLFLIVISKAGRSTVGNVNIVDGFLGRDSLKWNYCNSSFSSFSKSYNMVIIFSYTYKVIHQQSKLAQEPSDIGFWKFSHFLSQYFIYLNLALFPRKFSLHLGFLMYLHITVYNLLFNYFNLHSCDYMDLSFYSHLLFYIFFLIRFSKNIFHILFLQSTTYFQIYSLILLFSLLIFNVIFISSIPFSSNLVHMCAYQWVCTGFSIFDSFKGKEHIILPPHKSLGS